MEWRELIHAKRTSCTSQAIESSAGFFQSEMKDVLKKVPELLSRTDSSGMRARVLQRLHNLAHLEQIQLPVFVERLLH